MRRLALLAALSCVFACDDDDGGGGTMEDGAGGAAADAGPVEHDPPEGDVYVAGLEKVGAEGNLKVRLLAAEPAPPDRGVNHWTIEVLTMADEAPMDGCQVGVEPDMPAHGHGTQPVTIATLDAPGTYAVRDMDLFMPGLWIVPIELTCGDLADAVVYEFWMEG